MNRRRSASLSKDFRKKKAIFEAPGLDFTDFSSDSSSMANENDSSDEHQSSEEIKVDVGSPRSVVGTDISSDSKRSLQSAPQYQESRLSKPSDLLKAAAALEFGNAETRKQERIANEREAFRSSNSILETRTTLSSPGRVNFSLREKFRLMSRSQRKGLLKNRRNNNSNSPSGSMESTPDPSKDEDRTDENLVIIPEDPIPEEASIDNSAARLERQSRYNTIGTVPNRRRNNRIQLHIYDLLSQDALMQLPMGFMCEIGRVFNDVNSACHDLGTGAYHVGVEINGVEYAYGATNTVGKSGVFACTPRSSPGYQYRTTIDFGELPLVRSSWVTLTKQIEGRDKPSTVYTQVEEYVEGEQVIKEMQREYMGTDYDILRKNCCSFARDACLRLGIHPDEVPSWFSNLAESGATTHDLALQTVEPIKGILTTCEESTTKEYLMTLDPCDSGFEVVAKRNNEGTKDVLVVLESKPSASWRTVEANEKEPSSHLRRTHTWAY
jgi:hypothetical protein